MAEQKQQSEQTAKRCLCLTNIKLLLADFSSYINCHDFFHFCWNIMHISFVESACVKCTSILYLYFVLLYATNIGGQRNDFHVAVSMSCENEPLLACFVLVPKLYTLYTDNCLYLSHQDFSASRETCLCWVPHDYELQSCCGALGYRPGKRWF